MVLFACPVPQTKTDSGIEDEDKDEVSYEGETAGGALPDSLPLEPMNEDAGEVVVDRRCCNLIFTITDLEAADVQGRILGSYGPLAGNGVPLTRLRDAGLWTAAACIPLNSTQTYRYAFHAPFDGGTITDAGELDGGALDAGQAPSPTLRASSTEPLEADGVGGTHNVVGPITDCGAADASVGTWP
jgi:hypothetical protein